MVVYHCKVAGFWAGEIKIGLQMRELEQEQATTKATAGPSTRATRIAQDDTVRQDGREDRRTARATAMAKAATTAGDRHSIMVKVLP